MKHLSPDIVIVEGNNELNVQMTPIAAVVSITSADWSTAEYAFTDVWGETYTAILYKCSLTIDSNADFAGKVILSCPNIISPVKLLTEQQYQEMLAEIDDLIATTTGYTQELWQARKEIALGFPSVDGFRIDYRWWADWDARFRAMIKAVTEKIEWGVDVAIGEMAYNVAFFKTQVAGITAPVTIKLIKDTTLIDSVESTLPGVEAFQITSVDIPQTTPGAKFTVKIGALVPRLTTRQLSTMSIRINLEPAGVHGSIRASEFISGTGSVTFLIDCVAEYEGALHYDPDLGYYTHWYKLPKGTYPVSASASIWSGYISDSTSYWYEQLAVYGFGTIGVLVVK